MAANAWTLFYGFLEGMADGTLDLDTDTFKCALFTSTYSPNAGTQATYGQLTNEVANGNGYTTGGGSLATVTWTESSGTVTFDAVLPTWTASGGSIVCRYAVIYKTTGTKPLVGYSLLDNSPADVTTTDGNTLTLTAHANGLFTLAQA